MDFLTVVIRLVHVGLGVFWGGAVFFTAFFLGPALRDAGPDGAKVAAGLTKRGMLTAMPIAAILTILSGFWLYWRASAGQAAFMGSTKGMTYGIGGAAAVIALLLGFIIVRPAMLKATALMQSAGSAAPAERDAQLAAAQAARARATQGTQVVTYLMIVAVAAMAIGRYV